MGHVNLRIRGPSSPDFLCLQCEVGLAAFSYRGNKSFRLSVFVWSAIAFFWRSAAKCKQGVQPRLNVHTWAQIYSICFKACRRSGAGLVPTLKRNPLFLILSVFQPFQDFWRSLAQHWFHWSCSGNSDTWWWTICARLASHS